MIANVLNTGFSEGRALLSGNIGFPASTVAQTASAKDRLIMELSSFQLMGDRNITSQNCGHHEYL